MLLQLHAISKHIRCLEAAARHRVCARRHVISQFLTAYRMTTALRAFTQKRINTGFVFRSRTAL